MTKRTAVLAFLALFGGSLGAGCGLDTAGLGGRSDQPGSTMTQHAEAGANVQATDASPAIASDAAGAAADGATPADASTSGCGASTCGPSALCCVQDLGGGVMATSCAADCGKDAAVVCDPGGAACAEGDCRTTEKFPGLSVCN